MGCAPSAGLNSLSAAPTSANRWLARFTSARQGVANTSNSISAANHDPTRQPSPSYCPTAEDPSLREVLKTLPSIKVDVGSGVVIPGRGHEPTGDGKDEAIEANRCRKQIIIFLFGGPGSLKGDLIQELSREFDFVALNVEDIVFSYLPNKVANTVSTCAEMQELIRRDPKIVSLKWLLQMISAKLNTSQQERFLIDVVPELQSLLRSELFPRPHELDGLLDDFDRKHPVLFALELNVADERSILEQKGGGKGEAKGGTLMSTMDTSKMSAEMTTFIRGIDEADKGRLERRLEAYRNCSASYLKYFRRLKKVLRMELKVPNNTELLPTARRLFADFGLSRNADTAVRVVLFVMGDYQVEELDAAYYRLKRIRLLDVCHDKSATIVQQIKAVRRHIQRTARARDENYMVLLKGLNKTGDYVPMRRINFLEYRTTYLDFFIRERDKSRLPEFRLV